MSIIISGGRRVRGRARANVLVRSEGPSLEDLAASGIKVDVLQHLAPKDPDTGALKKLIPYDQITMRGEDLTGLLFAQLPRVGVASDVRTGSSEGDSEQGEGSAGGTSDTRSRGKERLRFFTNVLSICPLFFALVLLCVIK